MTPQEKAKELVEKFEPMCLKYKEAAKQCAIICVEEKIKSLTKFSNYWAIQNGEWYKDELTDLEKLKQEIEKL